MSKNLRKCMKTMHLYCGTEKKPLKQALLNGMSKHDCFFDAIYEIINNLFLKNLKLKRGSISQRRKIRSFLPVLHKIKKKPENSHSEKVSESNGWFYTICSSSVNCRCW